MSFPNDVFVVVDCKAGEIRRYVAQAGVLIVTHEGTMQRSDMPIAPEVIEAFRMNPPESLRLGKVAKRAEGAG